MRLDQAFIALRDDGFASVARWRVGAYDLWSYGFTVDRYLSLYKVCNGGYIRAVLYSNKRMEAIKDRNNESEGGRYRSRK